MSDNTEIIALRKEMKEGFMRINDTLMELIKAIEKLDGSCSKMGDHISFVEGTYETLRSPLDYITKNVNRLRGVESTELPQIKNTE